MREIEKGSFTPLIFSATGAGPSATVFLKRQGELVSEKHDMPYSQAIGWLRCRLSVALLRSAILCLRAAPEKHSRQEEPPAAIATSSATVTV